MTDTKDIANSQFIIAGAGETIQTASTLPDVFAPPHHGPRNVPITIASLAPSTTYYTHFPIVRTGQYAIYLNSAAVDIAFIYSGTNQNTGTGTPIAISTTDFTGTSFSAAFVSTSDIIFTNDDPQPVAVEFSTQAGFVGTKLQYIVSYYSP